MIIGNQLTGLQCTLRRPLNCPNNGATSHVPRKISGPRNEDMSQEIRSRIFGGRH